MTPVSMVLAGNGAAACYALDSALTHMRSGEILTVAPLEPHQPWHESFAQYAERRGVACIATPDINSDHHAAEFASADPDLLLSVYYPQVFSPAFLDRMSCPMLNLHPSLLPMHRGVAPLIWAIVEGCEETGLTVHHIDRGVDTGPIVAQYRVAIDEDDTGFTLHEKLYPIVANATDELVREWRRTGQVPGGRAQEAGGCVHKKSDPRINDLDWENPARYCRNVVRALAYPLPGAQALIGDVEVTLYSVELVRDVMRYEAPGTVLIADSAVYVRAEDGALRVREVVVDGEILNAWSLVEAGILRGPA